MRFTTSETSEVLFIEKFVPLLPEKAARHRIAREFFAERQRMAVRSPQQNAQRKLELSAREKPTAEAVWRYAAYGLSFSSSEGARPALNVCIQLPSYLAREIR